MKFFILLFIMIFFKQSYQSPACYAPVGQYCPSIDNSTYFLKCGKGKYQDETGQTFCKSCKVGEYNIQIGQSKCNICPIGHSCLWNDKSPVNCRDGQYQDQKGKTFCEACPIGKVCSTTGIVTLKKDTRGIIPDKLPVIRRAAKYSREAYKELNPDESKLMDKTRIKGFVKYKGNEIVVSFQGSKYKIDWWRDLKILKKTYLGCPNCKVHSGFFQYYNLLETQMFEKVKALSDKHPGSKIIVTGHSLGGAIATLAAVDLVNAKHTVDLITFGSPRVGNKEFAQYIDTTVKGLDLRVTYKGDPVTDLPPKIIGYRHVGQEIHCFGHGQCEEFLPNQDPSHNDRKLKSFKDHSMNNYFTI